MFFRRRKRKPLKLAVLHMQAATRILHRHWRDQAYEPTVLDHAEVQAMEQMLFGLAKVAGQVAWRLERRSAAEPENDEAKCLGWRER